MLAAKDFKLYKEYSRFRIIRIFDNAEILYAQERFRECQQQQILSGNWDDMTWKLQNEYERVSISFQLSEHIYQKVHLQFGLSYTQLVQMMKVFAICMIGSVDIKGIKNSLNDIRKLILSLAYDEPLKTLSSPNRMIDFLETLPDVMDPELFVTLVESLESMQHEKNMQIHRGDRRKLATFQTYFRFDKIITDYWSGNLPVEERLFYFPLWFWWKLTSILPMRPREFLFIYRDCIHEKNGHYYLTTVKNKVKGVRSEAKHYTRDGDYQPYTVEIPYELYQWIYWYFIQTEQYPADSTDTLFRRQPHANYLHIKLRKNSLHYSYHHLNSCLKLFYTEIIEDTYQYHILSKNDSELEDRFIKPGEIETINFGDTRHLAVTNILMSGMPITICKELAGHMSEDMSYNYYNILHMTECQVYETFLNLTQKTATAHTAPLIPHKKVPFNKTRIPGGWCHSTRLPNNDFYDCLQNVNESGEIAVCKNCLYYAHDMHGKIFEIDKKRCQDAIMLDCQAITNAIELVRKGYGQEETLGRTIMRLQASVANYRKFLLEELKQHSDNESYFINT